MCSKKRQSNREPRPTLLLDFMQEQIDQLKMSNRFGTAVNYEKVRRSISRFVKTHGFPLSAISERFVTEYNAFLVRKGMVRNSISFHMRVLRAIYNKAVRQKLVIQTYPFSDVYTGIDKTRKRAVAESVLVQLHRMELPERTPLAFARDLFIFSYCTRGMAFVDIAFLKRSCLKNGEICYARHKTGQILTIRIEPTMQKIIDRYSQCKSDYVFPIISSTVPENAYRQYQNAINRYNRQLRKLSRMLNPETRLTSYTARHSWATAARNHSVPISVISAGMGHTSEKITRVYLASLENSVIDNANRKIIKALMR